MNHHHRGAHINAPGQRFEDIDSRRVARSGDFAIAAGVERIALPRARIASSLLI